MGKEASAFRRIPSAGCGGRVEDVDTPHQHSSESSRVRLDFEAERASGHGDDRRKGVPTISFEGTVARAIEGITRTMDDSTSFFQDVFVPLHGFATSNPFPGGCEAGTSIPSIRKRLSPTKPGTNYSGDVLDNVARYPESAGNQTIGSRRTRHKDFESTSSCVSSQVSNRRHTVGDGTIRDDVQGCASVIGCDRDVCISSRSANLRHDPARGRRSSDQRLVPDGDGSSWKDDVRVSTVHPLDAKKRVSSGNIDQNRNGSESSVETVPLQRFQSGRRATEGPLNNQGHADIDQRSARTAIVPTGRSATHGAARLQDGNGAAVQPPLRRRNVDEVPWMGTACRRSTEHHDRSTGCDDDQDELSGSLVIHDLVEDSKADSRLKLFAKRPTEIAKEGDEEIPLHVQFPAVPFLSWSRADALVKKGATQGEERLWFESTAVYRDPVAAQNVFDQRTKSKDVEDEALLLHGDLEVLLDSSFVIDTKMDRSTFEESMQGNVSYIKLFSTIETRNDTTRRRIIEWNPSLNDAEQQLVKQLKNIHHAIVMFHKASEVRDRGTKFKYAASLDFKKFYQQFELLVKNFWAFVFDNRVYLLATIPTGSVLPPFFAQILSKTMLAIAVRASNTSHLVANDCCIDNLRLCSDNLDALWSSWHELLSICSDVGITIGELNPPPLGAPNPYNYLGMLFSVIDNLPQVELSERSKLKVDRAVATLTNSTTLLVVDVLAIFGQTIWACTVTGFNLGKIYHIVKFIRRISRKAMNEKVTIWPSIVQLWIQVLTAMKTMKFRHAPNSNSKATMFTDACESGWGVVIFGLGNRPIRIAAGRWSASEAAFSINVLELKAFQIGTRIIAAEKNPNEILSLHAFIDNTSARSWAARRRAPRWMANQVATTLHDELASANILLRSLDYVPSAYNLADKPSRKFENAAVPASTEQLESDTDGSE